MESPDAFKYSAFFKRYVSDETINTNLAARQGGYLNSTGLHNLYQTLIHDDLTDEEIDSMINETKPEEPGKINEDKFIKVLERAQKHETSLKWKKIENRVQMENMDQMASALPSSMAQDSLAYEEIPPSFYNDAYSDEENDVSEPEASPREGARSFYESLADVPFDNPNDKAPMGGKRKYKKKTAKKQRKTSRKQRKSKKRRSSRKQKRTTKH
jgi:hypothetical protein